MSQSGSGSLLKVLAVLLVAAAGYFGWKHAGALGRSDLAEGDVLETRPCRECQGKGTWGGPGVGYGAGAVCPACEGKGTVEVILPGPLRDTRVFGAVVEAARAFDEGPAEVAKRAKRGSFGAGLLGGGARKELPAPVGGASVRFERAGDLSSVSAEADSGGRFAVRLLPGIYRVQVQHEGFAPLSDQVIVNEIRGPIWLERRRVERSALPTGEAQVAYGLLFLAGLVRPGEVGAFARLYPAEE